MRANYFEFIVEERSMEVFLEFCLPKILPNDCKYNIRPFGGKDALLRKLPGVLKGYAHWLPSEGRIVVIVDRDCQDCMDVKSELEDICKEAGLRSRQAARSTNWQVVTRIATEELEAWYFGDWAAVCQAFPGVPATIPRRKGYRDPDAIKGGTWEAFERILQEHRYFGGGLSKTQAATDVGRHFDPQANTSRSFQVLRDALIEATT